MNPKGSIGGFTIIEVAMAVLVVGLIAAIAIPAGNNNEASLLDAAAMEVATMARFARDEAMRTGDSYGIRQQNGQNRVRVFRIDGGGALIYDVYHPTAKQLWDIDFDTAPQFRGVASSRSMSWRAACNVDGNVAFRPTGTPYCTDPTVTLLDQATISLDLGNHSRKVAVDGFTGRVTVH